MNEDLKYWLMVLGIIVLSYFLSLLTRKLLSKAIKKRSDHLNEDPTKFVFLKNSASFIIFTIAVIVIFLITPGLNDIGKGLFAGAGILAATLGFASQKAFSNILSGVFILIFRPFSVKDTIEIKSEGTKGVIEEITLRHTIIRDYENRRVIIPNSMISDSSLINSSIIDQRIRKHIEFGISYDSDVDLAKKIIIEEIAKHPKYIDARSDEQKAEGTSPVLVRMIAMADFSINLKAYVWTASNDDAFDLQCDVLDSIKKRFDREGVEVPFPYRTVVFKKDLPENAKLEV